MPSDSIRDRCHINTNYDSDTFVGIRCENGEFSICFPMGFDLADDEKTLRKDIMVLVNTISSLTKQMESKLPHTSNKYADEGFPFQAYLYILSDFFSHGYYKEKEMQFHVSRKGKIDWNRTIKTQKPYVQGTNAFYLDFITQKQTAKENELITLIHEYCVFDSMRKIGWLFTSAQPANPRIKLNVKLFRAVLTDKLRNTFNDRNRTLFNNMLAIVDYLQNEDVPVCYKCGTSRFEYVWEALVDKVFGIEEKEFYFPKTTWTVGTTKRDNACLEPDTIMIYDGNVYVLDAKYYKYGVTRALWDLPESTSINKQITYGEFIAEEEKFKRVHGEFFKTYNAFIMPYNRTKWSSRDYLACGIATSDWKHGQKEYETVVGVLVDIKHLMRTGAHENEQEISMLAKVIEKQFA